MTGFVQLIEYRTDHPEQVDELLDERISTSEGTRTATRTRVCRDHHDPARFVEILEFPSREVAMANSELPATNAIHEKFALLCEDGPHFTDLEVRRDQPL